MLLFIYGRRFLRGKFFYGTQSLTTLRGILPIPSVSMQSTSELLLHTPNHLIEHLTCFLKISQLIAPYFPLRRVRSLICRWHPIGDENSYVVRSSLRQDGVTCCDIRWTQNKGVVVSIEYYAIYGIDVSETAEQRGTGEGKNKGAGGLFVYPWSRARPCLRHYFVCAYR